MTDPEHSDSRLIGGRYRLQHLVGRGGMGSVWAGYDEILHRKVAVKEVSPSSDLTDEQRDEIRQRTMREARAAARLTHPSVVTVYDVVEDGDQPWIVMELLTPRTLADLIAADGRIAPAEAARIGLDVLDALRTAHRVGVLHRDVKPGNVILSESGRAVLTDFGIATVEGDPSLTVTGMLVGSPGYMSPERARGERPTAASDIWSLGATLFAAVEGDPPFRREGQLQTLYAIITEQPPHASHGGPLQRFIARLLERDPARRPSAAQAYHHLRRIKEATESKNRAPREFAFAQKTTKPDDQLLSPTETRTASRDLSRVCAAAGRRARQLDGAEGFDGIRDAGRVKGLDSVKGCDGVKGLVSAEGSGEDAGTRSQREGQGRTRRRSGGRPGAKAQARVRCQDRPGTPGQSQGQGHGSALRQGHPGVPPETGAGTPGSGPANRVRSQLRHRARNRRPGPGPRRNRRPCPRPCPGLRQPGNGLPAVPWSR